MRHNGLPLILQATVVAILHLLPLPQIPIIAALFHCWEAGSHMSCKIPCCIPSNSRRFSQNLQTFGMLYDTPLSWKTTWPRGRDTVIWLVKSMLSGYVSYIPHGKFQLACWKMRETVLWLVKSMPACDEAYIPHKKLSSDWSKAFLPVTWPLYCMGNVSSLLGNGMGMHHQWPAKKQYTSPS